MTQNKQINKLEVLQYFLIYDRITGLNTRFRIMTGKVSMINQEQTCEEHLEILDAALAGDWDRAADSLQHHLELARDKAEGVIKVIRLW